MSQRYILGSLVVSLSVLAGCHSSPDTASPEAEVSEQQRLVEQAASVVMTMRADSDFAGVDGYLARARGVMIFPKVRKAGFIVGGEGGAGILVAKQADGGWSDPAFLDIGGGSAGLQIGYEESTVLFFLMSEKALQSALDGGFSVGGDLSVAAGTVGEAGAGAAGTAASDVVQVVDVGGVFAGASLTGAGISIDGDDVEDYYGKRATPRDIVLQDRFNAPGAAVLDRALAIGPEPRASLK